MAKFSTRKRTAEGKRETLRRQQVRAVKYATTATAR